MTHDSSIIGALFWRGDTLETAVAASTVVGSALNDGAGMGRVALEAQCQQLSQLVHDEQELHIRRCRALTPGCGLCWLGWTWGWISVVGRYS